MDIVLSKRHKALAAYIILFLILTLPLLLVYKKKRSPEIYEISSAVQDKFDSIEEKIGVEIKYLHFRASELYKRSRVSVLRHEDLYDKESFIVIKNGVVESYMGEVFYFKPINLKKSRWKFIKKEDYIYFVEELEKEILFIKKYNTVDKIFGDIKLSFPYAFLNVNFNDNPFKESGVNVQYDDNNDTFYISHLSKNLNRQLYLTIKFLTEDYYTYWKNSLYKKFLIFYLIIGLVLFFLLPDGFKIIGIVIKIIVAISLFLLLRLYSDGSMYMGIMGLEIRSVSMIAYFSFLYYLALIQIGSKIKNYRINKILCMFFITLSLSLSLLIIKSLNFVYSTFSFNPNYLVFLLSVFMLWAAPFRLIDVSTFSKIKNSIFSFIILNILFIFFVCFILRLHFIIPLIISISLLLSLLYKGNMLFETIRLFFISIAMFLMIFFYSESEKKSFISINLKNIFSNQNNYAKFISREMIHNIHERNKNLSILFKGNQDSELEQIWRRSIALKENISSGIYVISSENEMLSSFSFMIPYLKVATDNKYPLWMIDDFKAEYFGRTISLAVASINIYENFEYLGKIIIQVMNSSDLITRDHPDSNIFTLNRRIKGDDISYIKLNSKMQVIENPSNIDIKNTNRRVIDSDNWIKFKFMDKLFLGCKFESNDDTFIVFFSKSSFSEISSNIIKIFLLLIVANGILNFKRIDFSKLNSFLKTFSFKVFAILILISLFSAITFSIFSIRFNNRNREIEFRSKIFNNGGVAYNMISDIIQKNAKLNKNDLFFLSRTLNADITIYRNNRLLDTSNYNKILKSEIPVLINSKIPQMLEESEKFYMETKDKVSRIFFDISDYVVRLDFVEKWNDVLSRSEVFSTFIINIFFVLTVAGFLLAFLFRKKILSPINILNSKMSKVEKGELEEITEIPSEIEIKNLFNGFNSMLSGIYEQKRSVSDIARMKTLIKLSRWIAHEVKNPLTPIKLSAEQILRSLVDKRENFEKVITESVKYIIDETDHLRNISLGFLDISNLDKINVSQFDLVALCKTEISKLEKVYKKIDFEFESYGDIPLVNLDKIKITQVLKNLLKNSIESIKRENGKIVLSIRNINDNVVVKLKDNGSGIDSSLYDKLFDEDFSTKSTGTGLGLFIVKRIIDQHQGSINFKSGSFGTIVSIQLPINSNGDNKNEKTDKTE